MTSGFEQGSDFVSKRLTFDVPVEGLQNLREMNNELERFRVNSEAAARGGESFSGYIRELSAAQERATQGARSLSDALERMVSASERSSAGPAYSTAIPPGYSAPFQPEQAGMGTGRDVRPAPTTVPNDPWDELSQRDPRAYRNARHAWEGGQRQEDLPTVSISDDSLNKMTQSVASRDSEAAQQEKGRPAHRSAPRGGGHGHKEELHPAAWQNWRNRAEQWAGTAGQVMGGLGPGGSFSTMFSMAGRALEGYGRGRRERASAPGGPAGQPSPSGMGNAAAEEGAEAAEGAGGAAEAAGGGGMGALGGLLRFAGPAGAIIGGLGAVEGLIQKGGQQIQQYRNLGAIRGGGAGEGFGFEMQARMMALNPFITNEQSRQIIQSALTHGYTGKEFDTVTAFMTDNLTQMNMSVADSTQLLQTAAKNSSSSISDITTDLTHSMTAMKTMSQEGYNTLPERQQSFKQSYSDLVASGVDPSVASQIAGQSTNDYSNRPGMSQTGAEIQRGASTNRGFQMLMAQQMGIPGAMSDPDRLPALLGGEGSAKYSEAKWKVIKQLADWSHGNLTVFRRLLAKYGIDMDIGEATKVLDNAGQIGTGTKDDPQQQEKDEQQTSDDNDRKSDERREMDPYQDGLHPGWKVIPRGGKDSKSSRDTIRDKITDAYGSGAEVGSPGDKDWKPFDPNDKDQMNKLRSGDFHIRHKGDEGSGKKLSDLGPEGAGSGRGRDKPSSNQVHGEVKITVHPASMKQVLNIPSYVPLTANEQQANAGYGQATKNNPPPGDTVTTRGAR